MPSSIRPQRDPSLRIRVAPEEVTLATWPLRQQPMASLATIALAAAVSVLVGWVAEHWAFGALAAAALATTLWRTWLPVRYTLNGVGVTQIILGRRFLIPWTSIKRYEVRPRGVLLLADAVATPLAPLRGLYLPTGSQHEAALASLDYFLHGWTAGARSTALRAAGH